MAFCGNNSCTSMQYQELRIKMPYGHIAAKAYNAPSGIPVLCLHGHFQNSAVFDGLVPLFPKNWYIVSLDWCSSGKSSFLPVGSNFDYYDLVMMIRVVMEELKWSHTAIIAHSSGALMTLAFENMYPDLVACMIWIDLFTCHKKYDCTSKAAWCEFAANAVKEIINWEQKNTIQYLMNMTKMEAVDFFSKTHNMETLPKTQSEWLAERYCKENEDLSFGYLVDKRCLKYAYTLMQNENVFNLMTKYITSHLMVIKYKNGVYVDAGNAEFKIAHYKRVCKSFEYVELPGTHCALMTEPEAIAPHITEFINKHAIFNG